jgi:hypothetical protein
MLKPFIEARFAHPLRMPPSIVVVLPLVLAPMRFEGHGVSATTDARKVLIKPINAVYATPGASYSSKDNGLEAPLSVRPPAV